MAGRVLAVITGWGFAYRREDGAWSPRSEPWRRAQVDQPAMLPVARATCGADDVTMDDAPDDRDTVINDDGVEIVSTPTTIAHLKWTAERTFGDLGLVKAVVDLERRVMAIGGGLQVDEQAALLNDGSRQRDVWGVNLYPDQHGSPDWLEFDSTINLRPPINRSRSIQDPATQARVLEVVDALVQG
jgi:hypothetical protein